jgi:hypothetical protein
VNQRAKRLSAGVATSTLAPPTRRRCPVTRRCRTRLYRRAWHTGGALLAAPVARAGVRHRRRLPVHAAPHQGGAPRPRAPQRLGGRLRRPREWRGYSHPCTIWGYSHSCTISLSSMSRFCGRCSRAGARSRSTAARGVHHRPATGAPPGGAMRAREACCCTPLLLADAAAALPSRTRPHTHVTRPPGAGAGGRRRWDSAQDGGGGRAPPLLGRPPALLQVVSAPPLRSPLPLETR